MKWKKKEIKEKPDFLFFSLFISPVIKCYIVSYLSIPNSEWYKEKEETAEAILNIKYLINVANFIHNLCNVPMLCNRLPFHSNNVYQINMCLCLCGKYVVYCMQRFWLNSPYITLLLLYILHLREQKFIFLLLFFWWFELNARQYTWHACHVYVWTVCVLNCIWMCRDGTNTRKINKMQSYDYDKTCNRILC